MFIDLEAFRKNKRAEIAVGQFEPALIETMQIAEMVVNHPRA